MKKTQQAPVEETMHYEPPQLELNLKNVINIKCIRGTKRLPERMVFEYENGLRKTWFIFTFFIYVTMSWKSVQPDQLETCTTWNLLKSFFKNYVNIEKSLL